MFTDAIFFVIKTGRKQARKNKTARVKAWNLECANVGTESVNEGMELRVRVKTGNSEFELGTKSVQR